MKSSGDVSGEEGEPACSFDYPRCVKEYGSTRWGFAIFSTLGSSSGFGDLSIGFGSMPNPNHCDLVRRNRKDHTIIANSESEVPLPRACESSDIADAGITVFGEHMENANSRLPIDGPQFITSGFRPNEPHLKPNSRRTSSCGTTFPVLSSPWVRAIASASPAVTGSSSSGA